MSRELEGAVPLEPKICSDGKRGVGKATGGRIHLPNFEQGVGIADCECTKEGGLERQGQNARVPRLQETQCSNPSDYV